MSIASISRFVLSHKWFVVAFWVVVTVISAASVSSATGALSMGFDLPGRESTRANQLIAERYGTGGVAAPLVAVVTLPDGTTVDSPGVTEEIGRAFGAVSERVPETRVVSFASTGDRAFVSEDGRTTFGLIYTRFSWTDQGPDDDLVKETLHSASIAGSPIDVTGYTELSGEEEGGGEGALLETMIGGVGALFILLWVFGSFLAFVPLLIAGVAIVTTFLAVWGLTTLTNISFLVQFIIALIGLGIAIDYSLLVITRWREERAAGRENREAVQRAMETAGHSVVFSGTTVAIGLVAMALLPVPALRSMGFAGLLVALMSVLVSITLLPVLLATVGPRLDWPRLRRGDQHSEGWERWARLIVRRRGVAATVSALVLIALAIPALFMNVGDPDATSLASSGEAHDALLTLEAAGIGSGVLTPFEVVVRNGDPAQVASTLADLDGIRGAVAPDDQDWRSGDAAVVAVIPTSDGNSAEGQSTLDRVRAAADGIGGGVLVGGLAPSTADFNDAVYGNFPLMLGLIVVVTFVLLVRAFRSILLPLKAVVLNVLSIGATYGLLVLIWQEGYGSRQIWGIEPTHAITSWIPITVFAFLFGLSMDYEVFILSRMREEYDATGSTDLAVIRGIGRTARLVTYAALILVLAFVAMGSIPETELKVFGTGLTLGILLDATIVRAVLVPAAVSLMGHWNWWLPSWLDRVVPKPETAIHDRATAPTAARAD
ncbi:MAG: MMPL family transporter [Chloroflexia bacterium]|nr:MMPL family transporter [Chloroflexia bacterium]